MSDVKHPIPTAEVADEATLFVDYQLPRRSATARNERSRRYLPPLLLRALLPVLRYSTSRNAYVLRVAGRRFGPVLRPRLSRPQSDLQKARDGVTD
ncbi:MAG: hypothetical protein M3N47_06680 [Chloroflexota bacterium]|nr:hypothetical protein [Chloroflexota bacterium]